MGFSLTDIFIKQAVSFTLAGMLFLPGGGSYAEAEEPSSDHGCASVRQIENPKTSFQKHFLHLVESVFPSLTARYILNNAAQKGAVFCFDKALTKAYPDGVITLGQVRTEGGKSAVVLNPDNKISEAMKAITLIHEGRHQRQGEYYPNIDGGNIPLWDFVAYELFKEADARMMSIVFAQEMMLGGKPEFILSLDEQFETRPMLEAFDKELTSSGDMKAAMQAAVLAFKSTGSLIQRYANKLAAQIAAGMKKDGLKFDPKIQVHTIINKNTMEPLGDVGVYGNYMNAEMIEAVRGFFTKEDYQKFVIANTKSSVPSAAVLTN